jgi:hypothetical protein
MSYLSLNDVRSEALFASARQPSDEPTRRADPRGDHAHRSPIWHARLRGTDGAGIRRRPAAGGRPDALGARQVVADVFAVQPARRPALPVLAAGRPAA